MDMLILLISVSMIELLALYFISVVGDFWEKRIILSEIVVGICLASFPFILVFLSGIVPKVIFFAFQLLILLLAFRLIFGRLDKAFLRKSTKKNVQISAVLFIVVVSLSFLFTDFLVSLSGMVFGMLIVSILVGFVFLYQGFWTLKHFRLRKLAKYIPMKKLPTVTLAIPARNENHALSECLTAAVASDYPKLEILVLDDCSQDKTSAIIKAFAQEGVRFVQGKEPAEGWLGKNQAYKILLEHASGEYIVFADVDTILNKHTIDKLVAYALSNGVDMVSVLPQRRGGLNLSNVLLQLRYYWQIVLPVTKRRVPVASQLWLIKAEVLRHLGGFEIVQDMIVPEGHFARKLFSQDDYRFIVSNDEVGATTAKRWSSQMETAFRFLYPTFKREPIYTLGACLLLVGITLVPFVVFIYGILNNVYDFYWGMSAFAATLMLASYGLVVVRAIPGVWWLNVLLLPISLVQELVLLFLSMIMYEFSEVNWKGRNVCYPVISTKIADRRKALK